MQIDFKQYLTKRNIIIAIGAVLAVGIVIASLYLPGVIYRGYFTTSLQKTAQPVTTVQPTTAVQTVNLPMKATCSVSPSSIKAGETATWTVSATGGEGGYDYEWIGHSQIEGKTYSTITAKYDQAGQFYGTVFAYSGTENATDTCTLEVEPALNSSAPKISTGGSSGMQNVEDFSGPLSATCSVDKTSVTVGETITYTATASGGGGGYSYHWSGGYISGSNQNPVSYKTANVGLLSGVSVWVESANGETFASKYCPAVSVKEPVMQMFPASFLTKVECSVTPTTASIGDTVTWTANVINGNPPYKYDWMGGPAGLENKTLKNVSLEMTKSDVGSHSSQVKVTDDNGTYTGVCPDLTVKPPSKVVNPGSVDTQSIIDAMNESTSEPSTLPTESLGKLESAHEAAQVKKATVSCSANPAVAYPGDTVVWSATVDGIDESEVTAYAWSGDVAGSAKSMSSKYSVEGKKTAAVAITYGSYTASSEPCVLTVLPEEVVEDANSQSASEVVDDSSQIDTENDENIDTESYSEVTDNNEPQNSGETTDSNVVTDNRPILSQCPGVYYPIDIQTHWAEGMIKNAYDLCWVKGYADYTFRPNAAITRAEAVKIVMVGAEIDPNPGCYDADCGSPFMDLDMWQGPWIRPAYDHGIVEGYSDTRFDPNKYITRAEAAALVTRAYGIQPHQGCYTANCGAGYPDNMFADIYDFWQGPYIRALWDKGIVQGTAPNMFEPNRPISRAELLKMAFEAASS